MKEGACVGRREGVASSWKPSDCALLGCRPDVVSAIPRHGAQHPSKRSLDKPNMVRERGLNSAGKGGGPPRWDVVCRERRCCATVQGERQRDGREI